ncbi:MAG: hypothetical protein JWM42_3569 [Burkholderia sp.]|nr:hypothetical protein [Burkholderia sp.]
MEKHEEVNLARRGFLCIAGSAGAIGAIAVLVRTRAAMEVALPGATPEASEKVTGGYRETEHTRKYYYCAGYW